MNFDWQNLAALAVVVSAVAYIARHAWQSLAPAARGCGHCSACPGNQQVVQLTSYNLE